MPKKLIKVNTNLYVRKMIPSYLSASIRLLLMLIIFGELALWEAGEEIWLYMLEMNSTKDMCLFISKGIERKKKIE